MTISIACDWVICTCLPLVIYVFCFYLDTFQFRSCFYNISIFLLHFFFKDFPNFQVSRLCKVYKQHVFAEKYFFSCNMIFFSIHAWSQPQLHFLWGNLHRIFYFTSVFHRLVLKDEKKTKKYLHVKHTYTYKSSSK